MEKADVVIIGAGVLGCSVARELSRYKLDVLVLERAHDVGEGSSKANSGIVHAGFHARGGSVKGRTCARGNEMLRTMARELQVPFVESGGMMVAFNDAGVDKLKEKASRAVQNGAGKMPIVDGSAARALEPRLSLQAIAAMIAPSTAVISPFGLVFALAQNAFANGVRFHFGAEVVGIEKTDMQTGFCWTLHLADGERVVARYVANMAGDGAEKLDALVHPDDYIVRPRLGEYLVFDKQEPERAITHVIYQAQETDEGGTLLAPTVEGNLLAGPTSRNVRGFSDTASTAEGLEHVRRVALKLIPDLDMSTVIANFAGVRTNIVNVAKESKDFVVRTSASHFVSALGIKNPGLTCSPALALLAVHELEEQGLPLELDPEFDPTRKAYVPFLKRSSAEQRRLLAADSSYGHVICRCEDITEGDVRAILRRPLPPSTLDGVKRRLRTGMGRCQGAFCTPRVIDIMSDELGISRSSVATGERGGRFVVKRVK